MIPPIRRLLVPVDFTARSTKASEYAALLASVLGASVHLLHVEEPFTTSRAWDGCDPEDAERNQRRNLEIRCKLDAVAAGFKRTGATVMTEVCTGLISREIVAVATRRGTDLILMGTQGRS